MGIKRLGALEHRIHLTKESDRSTPIPFCPAELSAGSDECGEGGNEVSGRAGQMERRMRDGSMMVVLCAF